MRYRALLVCCLSVILAACGTSSSTQNPLPPINTPVLSASAPSSPATTAPSSPATTVPTSSAAAPTAPSSPAPTEPTSSAAPTATPATEATVDLAALQIALEPLVAGFERPTYVTGAGDGSGRLFVVEQPGVIWIVREEQRSAEPFLDIRELVGSSGNEQGLLSVAFHPDYASNGLFFVNYTNRQGDTVIARYSVSANADQADPNSAQILLTIDQPASNHNGGLIKFGPDGYLYIGMGDGGRAGDPWGNAQNLNTLLGKMLRIDVNGTAPYSVPADNPFVNQADVRPEIWAYGLRNPWRFAFDRANGDLYIADVGQNRYEEVHVQLASSRGGENYGWNIVEGDACYQGNSCDQNNLVPPVAVYSHDEGCSITGGYVYRGSAFPQMAGVYVYADFCSGYIWGLHNNGGSWESRLLLRSELGISSFGEDDAGELYLSDLRDGGIYRLVVP